MIISGKTSSRGMNSTVSVFVRIYDYICTLQNTSHLSNYPKVPFASDPNRRSLSSFAWTHSDTGLSILTTLLIHLKYFIATFSFNEIRSPNFSPITLVISFIRMLSLQQIYDRPSSKAPAKTRSCDSQRHAPFQGRLSSTSLCNLNTFQGCMKSQYSLKRP